MLFFYFFWFCNVFRDLGWTVSVVLKSGRLSDLIAQLQVLLRGVDEAEISSDKYDSAALTAQVAWSQIPECHCIAFNMLTI